MGLPRWGKRTVDASSIEEGNPEKNPTEKKVGAMEQPSIDVKIIHMFRFADGIDRYLAITAILAAILNGALIPIFSILFGNLINALGDSETDLQKEVNKYVLYLLYLACVALVAGYLEVGFFALTGFRQAKAIRKAFLKNVLRQEPAWFDANGGMGKVLQGLNEDSIAFQNAVSEKFGNLLRNLTTCVAGLIVAFWRGWDMALVIVATLPFLVGVGMAISLATGKLKVMVARANNESNGIAEEAIGNIRTITSYSLQDKCVNNYEKNLEAPRKAGIKQGFLAGLTTGATAGVFSFSYALAIWYGSIQVADGDYDGGLVINILFAGVMAGFSLGQAVPNLQFIDAGKAACVSLYEIIDRKPLIDASSPGQILPKVDGDIEFENVSFVYPARPDRQIFTNFSLAIPAGKSVALVGDSGSGKSTVIQLVERFYDPLSGKVLVDGHDLKTLQLDWWRSQMALVSQEPTLFNDSIFANIAMGKPGSTVEEVIAASTAANAHNFISRLTEGYQTNVGEKGTQLSGGQRQRIAIARAILRNPKVLLLDEATSALDNQSEKLVQESLDTLMAGKTTIIVAHRLSTVMSADIIAVVRKGEVVDQGTHHELLKRGGFYANLVAKQNLTGGDEPELESNDGAVTQKSAKPTLRQSVLSRMSVRLSVIPQDIMKKLKKSKEDPEIKNGENPFKRLVKLNLPEWKQGCLGIISSLALGLQMPAFALALAGIVGVFFEPTAQEIKDGGQKWALIYVGIGVGCWLFGMIQGWSFGFMGQNLAVRVKVMFLRSVLRQDIGWHDQPENASGKLLTKLSTDTMSIRGAVGDRIGVFAQNIATVFAAFVIAFMSSWNLTLVVGSLLPIMVGATFVQTLMLTGQFTKGEDDAIQANQIALEGVRSIKVVNAYSLQENVCVRYSKASGDSVDTKIIHLAGVAYGFSQFVLYCVICLAFWYGTKGVSKGDMTFEELMKAFCSLFFATFSLAQANVQFPDIGKAHTAAENVFQIIDRVPPIDQQFAGGARLPMVDGDIELTNVTFAYPARPERLIFKHFNLKIPHGTSCALVGESGHGKSTIVGLIERFYDPVDGKVSLDGVDIKSLNLHWLRSIIGLVGQEPVMFKTTILENIMQGNPHATMSQVVDAARAANALGFINNLPEQLNTLIGDGGIQLSGGQKQRIAIARAILRNPKILLLDEATSALDAESESIVQEALDKLMIGRTTIIIAHRLSTVRSATKIAAVYRGRVLEEGSHDELMALDRYYAYLVKASQS